MSRLNLDRDKIESCRQVGRHITLQIQDFIDRHTTVSIERATLRFFGLEDAIKSMPIVNLIVDRLPKEKLELGIARWFGRALVHHRASSPLSLALRIADGKINMEETPDVPYEKVDQALQPLVMAGLRRLDAARERKEKLLTQYDRSERPLKYLIVATGNIHDDVDQAKAAVEQGADCIAVIRSTAQSLIDYVPHGATTEGFGGTYATQENFKIMRKALDEVGKEVGRYIRLVNYSSGLCMAEIAVTGAFENLDFLLNDAMYGILFRDINMKRTFTDQYFSRLVIARAGITINTGEDNYLTTAESYRAFPQVLASQFINEQFGLQANLREEQMGLGHAFEMDPTIEDSFLYEIAQAEMVREIFWKSPVKYMPPTRHMTGDIFFGHVLGTMFNLIGVTTRQEIQLLGMPTEAIHNPFLQDRFISMKCANYMFNAARHLGDEIHWSPNGKVIRRARAMLEETHTLLKKVERLGLMNAIEQGTFANMVRFIEGGRGLDGVIKKDKTYYNPVWKALEKRLPTADEQELIALRAESPLAVGHSEESEAGQEEGIVRPHQGRSRRRPRSRRRFGGPRGGGSQGGGKPDVPTTGS
ncbi:MAG: lysine 5,6-aminomutase subunit alpha [Deltaproteobacteria bacterium]|nr:lysine 5,6-aminomutase subunit alpha [Deltaproteobacteria bacterium]